MSWVIGILLVLVLLPSAITGLLVLAGRLAVPPHGRFVEAGGGRIHYRDMGDGPALVLIHGAGAQMRSLTATLEDRLKDRFRVVSLDRPGMGYSDSQAEGDRGLDRQAEILLEAIDRIGVERPVLVGHSLGGAISLAMAARAAPGRLAGLALIAPLTRHLERLPGPFRPLVIPSAARRRALSYTLAAPTSMVRGPETLRRIFAPETPPDWFAVQGGGLLAARPRMFRTMSEEATHGTDELLRVMEGYTSMSLPVAILYGREDAVLDAGEHGERTAAEIPGARIDLVEGGHMLPVTQPDLTADWIADRAAEITAEIAAR